MQPSTLLAIAAGIVHVGAYGIYSNQMRKGHSRPNPATWILWVFLSALNCTSYLVMNGDASKAAVAFAGAAACTVTFAYSLGKGRISRPSGGDMAALGVGLIAAAAWWAGRSATYANLILQFGFFVSMLPTYRGVLADPTVERPLPWLLWGLAYAMNTLVVMLRWQGHAADLAYPMLSLASHAGVGLLTISLSRRPALAAAA